MAAQMKQLEQRLMALRAELREKENKARQAEASVQDLKLQLDDLQVCNLPVILDTHTSHTYHTGKRSTHCLCWPRLYYMHSVQCTSQRCDACDAIAPTQGSCSSRGAFLLNMGGCLVRLCDILAAVTHLQALHCSKLG